MNRAAISTEKLNALMNAAMQDASAEGAFFRGLLDATLYAHVPKKAPPEGRMRFVMFTRPDTGELVLPFFTDRIKAEFAGRDNVGIVALEGRRLFELTQGASLMLNPNDDWLMLYPPEVQSILAGESLAHISKEVLERDEPITIRRASAPTDELSRVLADHFASEPDIEAAYLVEIARGKDLTDLSILVTVIAPSGSEGRIVQTSSHALQRKRPAAPMPVIISVEPACRLALTEYGIQIYPRPPPKQT